MPAAAEAYFVAHPFWQWAGLGGLFLIGEMMTGSGWLLWPAAAAAVVAGASAVFRIVWPEQLVLFVISAVVATYIGRRFLRPQTSVSADINEPAQRLIGQSAETTTGFAHGHGRVFVDGKEWAAELEGGGDLPAQAKVEVVGVLGARLKVKAG